MLQPMQDIRYDKHPLAATGLNHRILVVDDEPTILELFKKTFAPSDEVAKEFSHLFGEDEVGGGFAFDLTTATQGEEAVEKVILAVAQQRPYAVVFLDVRMPPGIDGLETAKRIREVDSNIHIVIASAYSDYKPSEFRVAVFSHLYFLRKPLDLAEVEHMAYNACLGWNRNQQLQQELNSNVAYRNWLSQLFDALPMPVTVVDVDNYEVIMHSGSEESFDPHVTCHRLLHGQDEPCNQIHGGCPMPQIRTTGQPSVIEHTHFNQEGEARLYELHCVPIYNDHGVIHQMLEFSVDITDRQQRLLEKESLVRQQKQLFDTFRSTAHTMKNSISYLNGMVDRLIASHDSPEEKIKLLTKDRVELIHEQVSMIHTMLQLALGSARETANQMATLSMQKKINETLSLFAISTLGKGKQVATNMDERDNSCIRMTPIDCQTMLLNLLNNAADAVDSYLNDKICSGKPEDLDLLVEIQDQPMIHINLNEENEHLLLGISNRGNPIPEEIQQSIFKQGFSLKEAGNGVGLYDVQQILRQSGGTISVQNRGEEVVFLIKLPLVDCDIESITG